MVLTSQILKYRRWLAPIIATSALISCCPFSPLFLGIGYGLRFKCGGDYIGSNPRLSPDGQYIVYGSPAYNLGDICLIDSYGGNWTRLTNTPFYEGEAAWSPDGDRIAFVSERDHNGEVYIINRDGTGETRLTFDDRHDSSPVFSRDGDVIAFVRRDPSRPHEKAICVMRIADPDVCYESEYFTFVNLIGFSDSGDVVYVNGDLLDNLREGDTFAIGDSGVRGEYIGQSNVPDMIASQFRYPYAGVETPEGSYYFSWDRRASHFSEIYYCDERGGDLRRVTCFNQRIPFESLSMDASFESLGFLIGTEGRGVGDIYIMDTNDGSCRYVTSNVR